MMEIYEDNDPVLHLGFGEIEEASQVVANSSSDLYDTAEQGVACQGMQGAVENMRLAMNSLERRCGFGINPKAFEAAVGIDSWVERGKKIAKTIIERIMALFELIEKGIQRYRLGSMHLITKAKGLQEAAKAKDKMVLSSDAVIRIEGSVGLLSRDGKMLTPSEALVQYKAMSDLLKNYFDIMFGAARVKTVTDRLSRLIVAAEDPDKDDQIWIDFAEILKAMPAPKIRSGHQKNLPKHMVRYEDRIPLGNVSIYAEMPEENTGHGISEIKQLRLEQIRQMTFYVAKSSTAEAAGAKGKIMPMNMGQVQTACTMVIRHLESCKDQLDHVYALKKIMADLKNTPVNSSEALMRRSAVNSMIGKISDGFAKLQLALKSFDNRVARGMLEWSEQSIAQMV